MADRDYTFEDYERMAGQTHPDILPLCVESLRHVSERAYKKAIDFELAHATLSNNTGHTVGVTALVAASVELQYRGAKEIFSLSGSLDKYIIGAGVAVVAFRGLKSWTLNRLGRSVVQTAHDEHEALNDFYQSAQNRAVDMGLIQSEE